MRMTGYRYWFSALALAASGVWASASELSRGAKLYQDQCVKCHGPKGEGVADEYDEPLYGERSLASLTRLIERTMPEDDPDKCLGEDAEAVASYIYDAFYSLQARARINPPTIDPARLTNRQYRESVTDLIATFLDPARPESTGGLEAEYYQSKGMNKKDQRKLERVDQRIDFDFGTNGPAEDIADDQFSIAWSGSLLAPVTGHYEFRLSTPNGARLYLNTDLARGDSNRRDDSAAKRQDTLIDMWVSSGSEMREETGRLFLLGGRVYPIRLDYFKFKDKTASIRLEWKPPHGVWSVLSGDHMSPESTAAQCVIETSFPPDDGSFGYERGTAVSKGWHDATTRAAVEAANHVVSRLGLLSGSPEPEDDRRRRRGRDRDREEEEEESPEERVERLKAFCARFAERAFRRPLTEALRAEYVDRHFVEELPPEIAVKRVVLLVLKSPRFLYPDLGDKADSHAVASRLALALWDSLPDEDLLEAAARQELSTPAQVRAQAERMMGDPRAKAKLKGFFDYWLAMEEAEDLAKDREAYPDFDDAVIADLRLSLEEFVERTVWSERSDYRELLLADYLFLNERLAEFYGAKAEESEQAEKEEHEGNEFVKVGFDPSQRAGIFTHPFLLSAFSYHKSSSPIHRGVFLTRNVLGRFLKPPPMAIEFMDDKFDDTLTMREKVTELTKSKTCMACHATINPLGFSLEHYDAVGRFRTSENDKPINAESDYVTAEGEVLRLRGPRDLAGHAAESADARLGFIRQMFHHAVKQPPAAYGPDTLHQLDARFTESGHHMRRLLVEIAVTAALHGITTSTPTSS